MKHLFYALCIGLLLMSCGKENKQENAKTQETTANENASKDDSGAKMAEIKSGIITYEISGSGNVMGQKMTTSGTARLVFKDWGATEKEERKVTETYNGVPSGSTQELNIIKGGMSYDVDYQMHQIIKTKDPRTAMIKEMNSKSLMKASEKFMTQMGGQKTGTEKFKGYRCDVWKLMGTKVWVYKGFPLKTESNMMGVVRVEKAVKIKFNTSVSNSEFELPKDFRVVQGEDDDFPTAAEVQENMKEMQEMKTMTYEEWKKKMAAEGELKGVSEEQLKKAYEMMHNQLNQ